MLKKIFAVLFLAHGSMALAAVNSFYCLTSDSQAGVKVWLSPESMDLRGKIISSNKILVEFVSQDPVEFGGLGRKDEITVEGQVQGQNFIVKGEVKNSRNAASFYMDSYKKILKFKNKKMQYEGSTSECDVLH